MLLEPMLGSRIGIGTTFVHEIENRFIGIDVVQKLETAQSSCFTPCSFKYPIMEVSCFDRAPMACRERLNCPPGP